MYRIVHIVLKHFLVKTLLFFFSFVSRLPSYVPLISTISKYFVIDYDLFQFTPRNSRTRSPATNPSLFNKVLWEHIFPLNNAYYVMNGKLHNWMNEWVLKLQVPPSQPVRDATSKYTKQGSLSLAYFLQHPSYLIHKHWYYQSPHQNGKAVGG